MCLGIGADMAPVPFWVYRAKCVSMLGGAVLMRVVQIAKPI